MKKKKAKQTPSFLQQCRQLLRRPALPLILIAAAAILGIVSGLYSTVKHSSIELGADDRIDITPQQIQSIKAIGEWEFLAISDEELVDTVRKGFFSDDQLARIYYGTIRLGIDLHQVDSGWIRAQGDTVELKLPRVGLLDKDFIDETRTKSFFESGRWTAADREALYQRAYQRMLAHCLTPQNLRSAEQNADKQVRQMMRAMGFEHITITYQQQERD
ncbi:MAG: DUF4230 domain-containing protein [Prevotella sp.]|nr:DUF4230 domain-containing protein [Prevotella sp.]